jgi:hypothetical protein
VPHPQVSDGAEVDVAFTIGYINLKGVLDDIDEPTF